MKIVFERKSKMRILMIVCVVLSTVFISCARTHDAKTENSSAQATNLVEAVKTLGQINESLQAGMTPAVKHSNGF
jgi:outer membrane murein-binding lipoprotein Lpp